MCLERAHYGGSQMGDLTVECTGCTCLRGECEKRGEERMRERRG